jgi:hypothetical protein
METDVTTGTSLLPRRWTARVQLLAALILVVLAFSGAAAVKVQAAVSPVLAMTEAAASTAIAPADAPAPAPAAPVEPADRPDGSFTFADHAAGRVSQEEQDRFWQAQLDAILAAPCPAATAGGTTVTLFVGADETWTERLQAGHAEHRAACAG